MILFDYGIFSLDTIEAIETEWLWYPYIPLGKVTIIQGDPGEGKTTLALNIAAAVTRGDMLGSDEKTEPANVLFQTAEDGIADTVKPRLVAAGADCSRVMWKDESQHPLSMTDDMLEELIQLTEPKLVILDPLQAYLGANVDMHRANEIRPVMSHIENLASKYKCAIVLIGHMNKNMGTKTAYRGLGSIDITAAARSVIVVARDKKQPDIRVVGHIKSSLAPEGDTIAFRLSENNGFTFMGKYNANIDDLLIGVSSQPQPKMCELASQFLMAELGDGKPKPAKNLIDKANEISISYDTLKKAKSKLSVQSVKIDNIWHWQINV
ncbi:MAG: AAA family ATPase [Ruminococcus sp.]|nr:AAA family ATPase [Ruminococcus sp.]